MGKLQEIKDQVAREYGYKDWEDRSNYRIRFTEHDATLDEVSSRYAKAVADDVLKRAAENAHITMVVPDGTDLEKLGTDGLNITVGEVDNYKIRISKESILSTEINLDL